jgi:Flp pilus assembly pilin Flp
MDFIQQFVSDTSGATLVEYALMLTFIAMACFVSVQALGISVQQPFNDAANRGFGS